jgi:hypothetical protein
VSASPAATSPDEQRFPDIVDVAVTAEGGTFRFDVTVSSPYDTPERYADAWRIVARTAPSSACANSPTTTRTSSRSPGR